MLPVDPSPSRNLVAGIKLVWAVRVVVNALRAGTVVAVGAGAIGYFVVLRKQSFAGHTLALVGFPGAAGATLIGIPAAFGYFGFCVSAALVIAALRRGRDASLGLESAVTGTTQSFALACGFLFIALYKGFLNGINALLFGNFLGITNNQVLLLAVVGVIAVGLLVAF